MKKIGITATVAVLVILLAAFALIGCNEKMTVEEGREVLSDSIEKTIRVRTKADTFSTVSTHRAKRRNLPSRTVHCSKRLTMTRITVRA